MVGSLRLEDLRKGFYVFDYDKWFWYYFKRYLLARKMWFFDMGVITWKKAWKKGIIFDMK